VACATDAEALLDALDALRRSAAKFSEPLRAAHRAGKPLLLGLVHVLAAANAHLADPAATSGTATSAVAAPAAAAVAVGKEIVQASARGGAGAVGDEETRHGGAEGEAIEAVSNLQGSGARGGDGGSSSGSGSSSSASNGSLLSWSFGATFGSDAEKSIAELSLKVEELQGDLARQDEVGSVLERSGGALYRPPPHSLPPFSP
jgi:hypothetical protein